MTDHTSELSRDASFAELAAGTIVRAVEIAAIGLVLLLVCPALAILAVVVGAPLAALALIVAVFTGAFEVLRFVVRHLHRRREHHTQLVLRRLQRVPAA